ncbi:hypothetical protein LOY33_16560 [Pseudomonas sp. B21-036]|uniref:hypothetical protein n=1 Tax=unclassified Pseudomonas TaxID=196821 RepID=UPI002160B67B|nr:hypothetical protein [Pseudomonas sp. B21-036]UVL49599.1 hypothetical protein LOY33_16560 [Pseudomonas sp. B21-036]
MIAVQPTDLRNQGRFLAETHENVFDRLTMLIQQGFSESSRALKRPVGADYFDAEGWRIANLANPLSPQDAATRGWAEAFIASILATGQGPVNNAANVIYAAPDGSITVVQAMSGQNGSGLIGYSSAGPNTVPRTVQEKLREVVSRADYAADAAFTAARAGKVSIDESGNLAADVLPTGGSVPVPLSDLARDAYGPGAIQALFAPRPVIRYYNATSVQIHASQACMGEFRFMAGFTKNRGRVLPLSTQIVTVSPAGLGAESSFRTQNWYTAFAVANTADTSASIE